MAYAIWDGASWVEQDPAMTVDQAAAAGAVLIVEPDYPAAGTYAVTASGLQGPGPTPDDPGTPTRWAAWTIYSLSDLQADKLAAALTAYDTHSQNPFSWNFGTIEATNDAGVSQGAAGVQTLQMRDDATSNDVQNWLGAQVGALTALLGGQGTVVLPLKTTANLWVQTTCAQVCQVLASGDGAQVPMLARQQMMLARVGALKSAIAAATDITTLDAIDVTGGWPA